MNKAITQISFLSAMVVLVLSACTSNVIFTDQIRARNEQPVEHEGPDVLRLYMDGVGDLYPQTVSWTGSNPYQNARWRDATLYSALRNGNAECGTANDEEKMLCEAARTEPSELSSIRWYQAQDMLWKRATGKVLGSIQHDTTRPVVIMIHGFNVDDAEPDYAEARSHVRRVLGQEALPFFVQVHWDGLTSSGIPYQAWTGAQYNGPLVGLKLRRLLEHIPNDQPVRIFTHSSGAFVAASMVGNAVAALPRAQEVEASDELCRSPQAFSSDHPYVLYACHAGGRRGHLPVPDLKNVRIGMMVPATPVESFQSERMAAGHRKPGWDCSPGECGILMPTLTLIVGANPRDLAVSKGVGACTVAGSSCLGTGGRAFGEYQRLRDSLSRAGKTGVHTHCINFAGSRGVNATTIFGREEHDWSLYMQRDKAGVFFEQLLKPGPLPPIDECSNA